MNLEIIWINHLGTEHNLGTVGEHSGKFDVNRDPIMIGDMVQFNHDGATLSTRVVKHWLTGNPQLLGLESISDKVFDEQKLMLSPKDSVSDGRTLHIGFGDAPDRVIVRQQREKNHHHDPDRSTEGFSLVTLAMAMFKNAEQFKPVVPNYDLLISLFGGDEDIPCKFTVEGINEQFYRKYVQHWSPKPGHHFYMFKEGDGIMARHEPLAYIRINENLVHGPNSYLRRIDKAYYFCEHLNFRFGKFIESIYRKPVNIPRGELITDGAVELAITLIQEVEPLDV